ncbi:hypothetical protein BCR32DRAFT_328463 [Anaeromyces robustus]|uniref:Uncharacterized protein n=1 Tax=Anaeromyces robustus TaxID=1754192 RepID=A0A1Y1WYL5_9FUNG|nr:hypothetical protein BCR32DRAFT_328463 [Anaeromyces robustus]|eukprot:ORX78640.1 hypothetical protein BCR32DRAFT_328463 [Anaeromyces robustus]
MTSILGNQDNSSTECITDYSQEFKIEMENSICNYFSKCNLEEDKHDTNRSETLIDNNEIEYISPAPSLKGISDFMINQIFSTDEIIPIEYPSDDEDTKIKNVNEEVKNDNNKSSDTNKMSSCNSDVTLNVNDVNVTDSENINITDVNVTDNENISKSFAAEFIDLLDINMRELNSKKDDFHVIGLKKVDEEKENNESNSPTSINFKDDTLDKKQKKNKRSKHISIFTLNRKSSNSQLSRSKSTNIKSSSNKCKNTSSEIIDGSNDNGNKLKKSKSKLGLSKIFKNVKKRMSHQY